VTRAGFDTVRGTVTECSPRVVRMARIDLANRTPSGKLTIMQSKIANVMTPAPVTLPLTAPIRAAATLMRDAQVGDVLVVEGDRLIGIVTDRDLVVRGLAEGADPDIVAIAEVATASPITVGPDDDPAAAVELMRRHAVRRVPMVQDGTVVGVVSLGDLAQDRDERSVLAAISAQPPTV
jgi:CBS domain-containing protein